jgi:hypothetical protein
LISSHLKMTFENRKIQKIYIILFGSSTFQMKWRGAS